MTISQRAQIFIDTPKFLLNKVTKQEFNGFSPEDIFRVRMSIDDTKLIELYGHVDEEGLLSQLNYQTNLSGIDLGFLDALFHILQGKGRRNLLELTTREVESFMRDENHVPAFTSELAPDPKIWQVINTIIKEVNKTLTPSQNPLLTGTEFEALSLVEKLKAMESLIEQAIRPALIKDGGDLKLVNINQNQVFISFQGNCSGCPSSQGGTLEFVSETIKKHFSDKLSVEVLA